MRKNYKINSIKIIVSYIANINMDNKNGVVAEPEEKNCYKEHETIFFFCQLYLY